MLDQSGVATRLPARDLARAPSFYAERLGNGVVFEEYDRPGLTTRGGIAEADGNYPGKGGIGERAVWFRDSEGNLLAIGQPVRRR